MTNLAFNRRVKFDYKLLDRYEAGIVLSGQEVKSVKAGQASLRGSFVTLRGQEIYLTNANIPPYKLASKLEKYDPTRPRKLLVKKAEIKSFIGKIRTQGLTLVPISLYTKKRLVKLGFAIARGAKKFDKRQDISKRESQRRMKRSLRSH